MPEEGGAVKCTTPQEPGTCEPQMSINKANIKVPVDIQDALEIKEELYAADGTAAQSITMDKRGYGFVQALALSTAAKLHIYILEYSFDNAVWFNEYTSGAAELSINRTTSSTARYWRLSSDAVGGAHTLSLVLGATLSS